MFTQEIAVMIKYKPMTTQKVNETLKGAATIWQLLTEIEAKGWFQVPIIN